MFVIDPWKANNGGQLSSARAGAHKAGRSRAEGKSSTAAAAYRAGVCIVDKRTGEVFDFSRKGGVESSEIIVPEGAHLSDSALALDV